jgi:hypothetical protein
MCLIKGAFVGKQKFWRYQDARHNDKKIGLRKVLRNLKKYCIPVIMSLSNHTTQNKFYMKFSRSLLKG